MKHAQTKYLPHLHVACKTLHTTNTLIKKIFSYHCFTHWAWKQVHISLYKLNPTIHFRRQKVPVRHTTKIFCLCRGYPPIMTFCMTNTKMYFLQIKLEDMCYLIVYNDYTRSCINKVLFQAVHRIFSLALQPDLFSGLSTYLPNVNKYSLPGVMSPRCKDDHSLP